MNLRCVSFLQICSSVLFSLNSTPLFYLCCAGLAQFFLHPVLCPSSSSYYHIITYLDLKRVLQTTMCPEAGAHSCSLEPSSMLAAGASHNNFHHCECDRAPNSSGPLLALHHGGRVWPCMKPSISSR